MTILFSIFKILELLVQNTEHGINHVLALVREDFRFFFRELISIT